jgi:hypothetical protein
MSYTFIFRKQFYFVISGLKIIGHGNHDNNLESHCIFIIGRNKCILYGGKLINIYLVYLFFSVYYFGYFIALSLTDIWSVEISAGHCHLMHAYTW